MLCTETPSQKRSPPSGPQARHLHSMCPGTALTNKAVQLAVHRGSSIAVYGLQWVWHSQSWLLGPHKHQQAFKVHFMGVAKAGHGSLWESLSSSWFASSGDERTLHWAHHCGGSWGEQGSSVSQHAEAAFAAAGRTDTEVQSSTTRTSFRYSTAVHRILYAQWFQGRCLVQSQQSPLPADAANNV